MSTWEIHGAEATASARVVLRAFGPPNLSSCSRAHRLSSGDGLPCRQPGACGAVLELGALRWRLAEVRFASTPQ